MYIWGRKLGHGGNVPEARIDIQTRHHHPRLSLFFFCSSLSLSFSPTSVLASSASRAHTDSPLCLFFPSAVYLVVRRVNGPFGMSSVMRTNFVVCASEDQIFPSAALFSAIVSKRPYNESAFDGTIRESSSSVCKRAMSNSEHKHTLGLITNTHLK